MNTPEVRNAIQAIKEISRILEWDNNGNHTISLELKAIAKVLEKNLKGMV